VAHAEPLIRNISDTALLAAVYRARETERQDALFRDPFARRLAGKRGDQIADSIPFSNRNAWAWVTRTYMFDQFIAEQYEQGVDMVSISPRASTRVPIAWLSPRRDSGSRSIYPAFFLRKASSSAQTWQCLREILALTRRRSIRTARSR
jgi:hypothetical protein